MKSQQPVYSRPDKLPNEISNPLIAAIISIIGHLILLGLFIFGPNFTFRHDMTPRVIDVTLVSMSAGTGGGPAKGGPSGDSPPRIKKETPPAPKVGKPAEVKEPESKAPEPKPMKPEVQEPKAPEPKIPEPKPAEQKAPVTKVPPPPVPDKEVISLAPKKIAPKESLKKKTFNPETVVDSALKRIEKKVEDSRRPAPETHRAAPVDSGMASVEASIKRMEADAERRESAGEGKRGSGAVGDGTGTGSKMSAGAGVGDGTGSGPELIYQKQVKDYIADNWVYSEQLADKNKKLEAWVMIEVMPDGKIRDFWFEKRSGNAYLDDSVARAIKKSSPLPAFPLGIRQSSLHLGFRFTPMGIQQ